MDLRDLGRLQPTAPSRPSAHGARIPNRCCLLCYGVEVMEVESLGSLPVGSLWWHLGDGPWVLSVICKGTLDLTPGELRLAARQDPITVSDQFMGGNRNASLYQPSDLVPYKPRVDIALVGWAYAAEGSRAESVVARLTVGELDKAITVLGEAGGAGPKYQPFTSAPLAYEYAAGGAATLNPVGVSSTAGGPRPRLLPGPTSSQPGADEVATAGFGPIAAHWPTRRRLLHGKQPPSVTSNGGELSLPNDFDLRYFNSAPADQQAHELAPGTPIVLEHLHPTHALLRTRLPKMSPQVFVLRADGERYEQVATIDTLWIDTQRMVANVTWRAVVELGQRAAGRKVWVVITEAGKRLTWDKLAKLVDTLGVPLGSSPAATTGAGRASGSQPGGAGDFAHAPRRWRPTGVDGAGAVEDALTNDREHPGSDTVAIPDFVRPMKDEEQTEVTQSVLLERAAALSAATGIPAWLARSAPAANPAQGAATPPYPAVPPPRATTSGIGGPQAMAKASMGTPTPGQPSGAAPPSPSRGPAAPAMVIPATAVSVEAAVSAAAQASPSPAAVRPPQPSWLASGGIQAEPRPPWEDETGSFPRVVSSLPRQTANVRREVVELLWYDPELSKRVRQNWRELADDLEFAPLDERHDLPTDDPEQARERHMHFGILTEAPVTDISELTVMARASVSETGRFTPPLAVVSGRLQFPFDELEILRATAAALVPLAGDDKRLKEALGNVKELLDTPLLQHSNELIDNFTKHLRSLYDQARRAVSRDYLDTSVERLLLEQRRYQKRNLFDGAWIRGALGAASGGEAVPVYLPEDLDKTLPMMVTFRTRMVVEVHMRQDQYEAHSHALKVVTLGRVLDIER